VRASNRARLNTISSDGSLRVPTAAHRFVIRPLAVDDSGPVSPALGPALLLSPLAGARDAWVTEVKGASPQAAWRMLQRRLGARFQALPILTDDEVGARYPTGRIGVRFSAPVSDADLQRLASAAGARVLKRTQRSDRQAAFAAADPAAQYLPDVVERLKQDPAVSTAWLDAQSAYRRGS